MLEDQRPDHVAVAANDGVRAAELVRLVGVQGGVDATEHDLRPSRARRRPDLVAAKRVAGVNPDADDVAGLDLLEIQRLQGLIDDLWLAILRRCRPGQHEEPARCDDPDAEGQMARVHEMDGHKVLSFSSSPHHRNNEVEEASTGRCQLVHVPADPRRISGRPCRCGMRHRLSRLILCDWRTDISGIVIRRVGFGLLTQSAGDGDNCLDSG